jgi:hypothetical protein
VQQACHFAELGEQLVAAPEELFDGVSPGSKRGSTTRWKTCMTAIKRQRSNALQP